MDNYNININIQERSLLELKAYNQSDISELIDDEDEPCVLIEEELNKEINDI